MDEKAECSKVFIYMDFSQDPQVNVADYSFVGYYVRQLVFIISLKLKTSPVINISDSVPPLPK